ncbi:heterokaryon incompatibility protein-domain-containing protein [Hypomontagnella monticulosa]|nr:heterokaryon incompatibility protein-domain-containing protein [Hypomontagnella monticulosa]
MLCPTCLTIFSGEAPRIRKDSAEEYSALIHKPHPIEKLRESVGLGCFICAHGVRNLVLGDCSTRASIDELVSFGPNSYGFSFYASSRPVFWKAIDPYLHAVDISFRFTCRFQDRVRKGRQGLVLPLKPCKDSPAWAQVHSSAVPFAARDPWLESTTVKAVRAWLDSCTSGHENCNRLGPQLGEALFYPTRLIYVGPRCEDIVRLIETTETKPRGRYVTLSHRWPGDPSSYTQLRRGNVQQLKERIGLEELSETFRDAVHCTRVLGVEYIWIDSLCIIQDSKDDWRAEAATMAYVYTNSYCNISATADECKQDGLFHTRRSMSSSHEIVTSDWSGVPFQGVNEQEDQDTKSSHESAARHVENYVLFDGGFWVDRVDTQELYTRGWIFQEQQLAPRVLHFGPDQLLWECNTLKASESYPLGLPDEEMSREFAIWDHPTASTMRSAHIQSIPESENLPTAGNPWGSWTASIINFYSRLQLTSAADRLIALSGVARVYHKRHPGHYLAGHWKEDLLHSLHWQREGVDHINTCPRAPFHRPEAFQASRYVAPSWSWASLDGPVLFFDRWDTDRSIKTAEFIDGDVSLVGSDPFGAIEDGYLLFRVRIYPAYFKDMANPGEAQFCGLFLDEGEKPIRQFYMDRCCPPDITADSPESRRPTEDETDEDGQPIMENEDEDEDEEDDDDSDDSDDSDDEEDEEDDEMFWGAKKFTSCFPSVFVMPLVETDYDKSGRRRRTGMILEPVSNQRGSYRRIGICCEGGNLNANTYTLPSPDRHSIRGAEDGPEDIYFDSADLSVKII